MKCHRRCFVLWNANWQLRTNCFRRWCCIPHNICSVNERGRRKLYCSPLNCRYQWNSLLLSAVKFLMLLGKFVPALMSFASGCTIFCTFMFAANDAPLCSRSVSAVKIIPVKKVKSSPGLVLLTGISFFSKCSSQAVAVHPLVARIVFLLHPVSIAL